MLSITELGIMLRSASDILNTSDGSVHLVITDLLCHVRKEGRKIVVGGRKMFVSQICILIGTGENKTAFCNLQMPAWLSTFLSLSSRTSIIFSRYFTISESFQCFLFTNFDCLCCHQHSRLEMAIS